MSVWGESFYSEDEDSCLLAPPLELTHSSKLSREGCTLVKRLRQGDSQVKLSSIKHSQYIALMTLLDPDESFFIYNQNYTRVAGAPKRVQLQCVELSNFKRSTYHVFQRKDQIVDFQGIAINMYRHSIHPRLGTIQIVYKLLRILQSLVDLQRKGYALNDVKSIVLSKCCAHRGDPDYIIKLALYYTNMNNNTNAPIIKVYKETEWNYHGLEFRRALDMMMISITYSAKFYFNPNHPLLGGEILINAYTTFVNYVTEKKSFYFGHNLDAMQQTIDNLYVILEPFHDIVVEKLGYISSPPSEPIAMDTTPDNVSMEIEPKPEIETETKDTDTKTLTRKTLSSDFYKAFGSSDATKENVLARLKDLLFATVNSPLHNLPIEKLSDRLETDFIKCLCADRFFCMQRLLIKSAFASLRSYFKLANSFKSTKHMLVVLLGSKNIKEIHPDVFNISLSDSFLSLYDKLKPNGQPLNTLHFTIQSILDKIDNGVGYIINHAKKFLTTQKKKKFSFPEHAMFWHIIELFEFIVSRLTFTPTDNNNNDESRLFSNPMDNYGGSPTLDKMRAWGMDDSYFIQKYFANDFSNDLGFPFPKVILEHCVLVHATTVGKLRTMMSTTKSLSDQYHRDISNITGFSFITWKNPLVVYNDPELVTKSNSPYIVSETAGVYMYIAKKEDIRLYKNKSEFEKILLKNNADLELIPIVFDWTVFRDFLWHFSISDRYGGIGLAAETANPFDLPATKVTNQTLFLLQTIYKNKIGTARFADNVNYSNFGELVIYAKTIPFAKYVPPWYLSYLTSILI
jgi:hypothetical protein